MILRNELPESVRPERHSRHGHNAGGAILAISPNGLIAKANLSARRIFGADDSLEGEHLGSALGRIMSASGLASQRLRLQVRDEEDRPHEITLVLSEQESQRPNLRLVPPPEATPVQHDEPASSTGIDFIAHELRNNLAITLGLAQVLEANAGKLSREDMFSAIRGIQMEAHHALQVLEGVLRLVESRHKGEQTDASVPVHAVVRRIVADHVRRRPERQVIVSGDEPVFASANSTWLQIALGNLLSNAEKVTPADKPIHLNIHESGDRVVVLVLDEGKALAAPTYEALWNIYLKGTPPGVELSGSGIGLSLCKELVQAMGGRVWAGPRSEGGSTFAISLRSARESPVDLPAAA